MGTQVRFAKLLESALRRGRPGAVYLASERGGLAEQPGARATPCATLSFCLRGRAAYFVKAKGETAVVRVRPGEVIFRCADCIYLPHPAAGYEALGIVFERGFTGFIHVRQRGRKAGRARAEGALRAGSSFTAPFVLDAEASAFCRALEGEAAAARAGKADQRYLTGLLELLLLRTLRLLRGARGSGESKGARTWRAACHFMREHAQEPIGRAEVAAFLDIHPNHLSRLFAVHARGSFNAWLNRLRLEHARRLLRDGRRSVKEVARASGFASAAYFSRRYRESFGVPPGGGRR